MKEKDIIDFEKMEKDEDGNPVSSDGKVYDGCLHCEVHDAAFEKFKAIQQDDKGGLAPLCPKCGKLLLPYTASGYVDVVVSEQNSYVPNGQIGMYRCYHCENCDDQNYAMMPIPICYNANHGTHYTGGRVFAEDADVEELCKKIANCVMPSINQYIERKMNPEDDIDKMLSLDNVDGWCKHDIEHAICNWLYERGYKK